VGVVRSSSANHRGSYSEPFGNAQRVSDNPFSADHHLSADRIAHCISYRFPKCAADSADSACRECCALG
jgi:hypothetical protein